VPEEVKRERNQRLLAKSEETALRALSKHVGSEQRVFVESSSDRTAETLIGRTLHQLPVTLRGSNELVGKLVSVRIEAASSYGMAASLL
jgi:tRNA-2-methylthio-N6-dimethylallyladenosine synthase